MSETVINTSGFVLDHYFDEQTMSLHLKANRPILRKKGKPGERKPAIDPNEIMSKEALLALIDELFREVETREDAFLEINRELSKVLQVGPYLDLWSTRKLKIDFCRGFDRCLSSG